MTETCSDAPPGPLTYRQFSLMYPNDPRFTEIDWYPPEAARAEFSGDRETLVEGLLQYISDDLHYDWHDRVTHPFCWGCELRAEIVRQEQYGVIVPEGSPGARSLGGHARDKARARIRWYLLRGGDAKLLTSLPEVAAGNSTLLHRNELNTLPQPTPLIEGILMRHSYQLLQGRHGAFKTFCALDWAASIATGTPWFGRRVGSGAVLYVAGEGAYGIRQRLDAWEHARGVRIPNERFMIRNGAVNLHADPLGTQGFIRQVENGGFSLVVIDTLRRSSGGADENSGRDMGPVVDRFEDIKRATRDGSVLVVHHTTKTDGSGRGYSGIEDDADVVWRAQADSNSCKLRCTKMKDGPAGEGVALSPTPVLESLVLNGSAITSHNQVQQLAGSEKKLLAAVLDAPSRTISTAAALEATGLSRSAFYSARGKLEKGGHISLNNGNLTATAAA